jgi:hypothetical protein
MWATFFNFLKSDQSKQSPMGENSPNLVTLISAAGVVASNCL